MLKAITIFLPACWPGGLSVRQWSGRPGFNPRLSHTKDFKKEVIDTQQYKIRIKGKMEQYRVRSSTFPDTSG